MIKAEKLCKT